ncbi:MAG: trigger factor [Pseudomonadota bacterium]
MQVTETMSEGLKRELEVVIPASDLDAKLTDYLDEMRGKVRINGFRPGKVPVAHLRKVYGKSAMAEIVQNSLGEWINKACSDREETPALQPDIKFQEDSMEEVLVGKHDLQFTLAYEIIPAFDLTDFAAISVERQVVEVAESEIDDQLEKIGESNRSYSEKDGAAADGDRVTMDFVGKIDGEPFEGGAGEGTPLVLGSNQFIPGFEEQLVGVSAGDETTVTVTFPEEYPAAHLAGKEAVFDVTVKEVAGPDELEMDDAFAERLGLESMEKLRATIREQIENEYGQLTRQRVKRQLLDALDEAHPFDLPAQLVDNEFEGIWKQITDDMERSEKTFEDEGTNEEAARADYHKIAERRVRLGLVLSKVGEANSIEVTDAETERALYERVRQFPGQEKAVFDYYRQNPEAMASLRAPVYEEKVVDFLLELVKVTDTTVTKEDLQALIEADSEEDAIGSSDGDSQESDAKDKPAES